MKRSLLRGFTAIITAGICGLMVIATEVWLRYQDRSRLSVYVADDIAIARFKPNIKRVRTIQDKPVLMETNQYGIRDDTNLNPSQADILVLGDSNVAALYLQFEETLGERIEEVLGSNLVAANLALPGYGPDQSANRFISIATIAKARAVVFHFFADNDFGDLFRNNIYRKGLTGEWVMRQNLENEPILAWDRYKVVQRAWQFSGLTRQQFDRHVAGDAYYSRTWEGREDQRSEYELYLHGQYTSWLGDHYDFGISTNPSGVVALKAQEILGFVLSKVAEAFKGKSSCIVFVIQPSEDDLLENAGFNPPRLASIRGNKEYYPRALVDIAIRTAREAGIGFIDLYSQFEANPQNFYYPESTRPGDNHWNENGIAAAALLVAKYLKNAECFEEASGSL